MANGVHVNIRSAYGSDVSDAIHNILEEYGEEVNDVVNEELNKTTKKALRLLRDKFRKHGRGTYAGSLTAKDEKFFGGMYHEYKIYSKSPYYGLGHLLEHGHDKVGKGRGENTVALGYWQEVETWLNKELPKRIIDSLNKIK